MPVMVAPMGESSSEFVPFSKSSGDPIKVPRSVPLIRAVSSGDKPFFFEHDDTKVNTTSDVAIHNLLFIMIFPALLLYIQLPNCILIIICPPNYISSIGKINIY
jgi:hypothetical protein